MKIMGDMNMNTTLTQIPPYITRWFEQVQPLAIEEAVPDPSRAGVFSSDVISGFLTTGNLASERVGKLARPVVALFQKAYDHGIRNFVLLQDAHHPRATEFEAFPPHAIQGSEESETIPELRSLPFSNLFTIIQKNSLHPSLGSGFDTWIDEHGHVNTAIVVGDCTDLCIYQLAMYLRLRANARNERDYHVIIPVNAVDTFDIPEEVAKRSGAMAHPGNFFHQVFLYHMAINRIRIVRELT
jgi:nicotinamidase-related amidase